jgi:hypothetical protein
LILLVSTSDILELLTTSTASTDYYIVYSDFTTSTYDGGVSAGNITTATTTTILSAPASSTRRQVKYISIRNRGSIDQTVTIKYDVSGTEQYLTGDIILSPNEKLEYNDGTGFVVKHSDGHTRVPIKITNVDFDFTLTSSKTGSAAEAALSQMT